MNIDSENNINDTMNVNSINTINDNMKQEMKDDGSNKDKDKDNFISLLDDDSDDEDVILLAATRPAFSTKQPPSASKSTPPAVEVVEVNGDRKPAAVVSGTTKTKSKTRKEKAKAAKAAKSVSPSPPPVAAAAAASVGSGTNCTSYPRQTILLGSALTNVVGTNYYYQAAQSVNKNTVFRLVREPDNPYDANAIGVEIISSTSAPPPATAPNPACKVGHLPRGQASVLAPFMDEYKNLMDITAICSPGKTITLSYIPITLRFEGVRSLSSDQVAKFQSVLSNRLFLFSFQPFKEEEPSPANFRTVADSLEKASAPAGAVDGGTSSTTTTDSGGHPRQTILLGTALTNIVGTNYYEKVAKRINKNTVFRVVREPENPYDTNAIRLEIISPSSASPITPDPNWKVGHIPRGEASILARFMDNYMKKLSPSMYITAICTPSKRRTKSVTPITLRFEGVQPLSFKQITHFQNLLSKQLALLPYQKLRQSNKTISPKGEESFPSDFRTIAESIEHALLQRALGKGDQMEVELSTVEWEAQRSQLDELFEKAAEEQISQLTPYPMPKLFTNNVKLFDHQIDGIRWLIHQERDVTPSYFEEKRTTLSDSREIVKWQCKITKALQSVAPKPVRGGILADDMGLGKTLQTIGLILSNPPDGCTYPICSNNATTNSIKSAKTQKKGAATAAAAHQKKLNDLPPRCTLIICPLSVMANWVTQTNKHINNRDKSSVKGKQQVDKNLSVEIYQGPKRDRVLYKVEQNQVDIMLVSYHTLAYDLKNYELSKQQETSTDTKGKKRKKKELQGKQIFDLEFHRIVLDEAHTIRNSKSCFFKAAIALQARRKLCLTGTPFVNSPSDIHSLLSFLGVEPLCRWTVFEKQVVAPIKERREIGLKTIRATMAHIALRRTKAKVEAQIQLVQKSVQKHLIKFPASSEHKKTYDLLYEEVRNWFLHSLQSVGREGVMKQYMEILSLVLRIRQLCCHKGLIRAEVLETLIERLEADRTRSLEEGDDDDDENNENHGGKKKAAKKASITKEEGLALLDILEGAFGVKQGESTNQELQQHVECAICLEPMQKEDVVVLRMCKHIFCQFCLEKVRNCRCPMCRKEFTPDDMVRQHEAKEAADANAASATATSDETAAMTAAVPAPQRIVFNLKEAMEHGRSPKVQAVLNAIETMEEDEKGVIFSQWTTMLDIVEQELIREGHTYTRIDGTMNAQQRIDAIEKFESERCDSMYTPRFILCSLHACGTGINLTRGNVVFMLDPWWNDAAESQAMDRVHRIGQTRPVRVMRFLMKDSIEERMVNLQESKAALGKGSMEKLSDEEKRKARITALFDLFQIKEDEGWTD